MSQQLFGVDFAHQRAASSLLDLAPDKGGVRDAIAHILQEARNQSLQIRWLVVLPDILAVITAASTGNPVAVVAALTKLANDVFGGSIPVGVAAKIRAVNP